MIVEKKKRMKNSTKFAILAVTNITVFTISEFILSAMDKTVPDSLIIAFFGAWTAELGFLFGIKKNSGE